MTPLDDRFSCLADPTRRAILMRLAEGEASVQELAKPFAISQPAISRHLRVMEEAGLIETRIEGSSRPRRIRPEAVEEMWGWLSQFRARIGARYDQLDRLLNDLQEKDIKT